MIENDIHPKTISFLQSHPSLELVDVTPAAGSTTGNGHSYFSGSPWVSSDLLALLAFDLSSNQRGLVKMPDLPVWSFPADYIERLQKNLKTLNPELAEGDGNGDEDPAPGN